MAFPTDTVWGVLALMEDEAACKRIYEVKGRPEDKPLQVLVADLESALELVDLGPLEGKFLRLAEALEKVGEKAGVRLKVLVEVNLGREPQKHGVLEEELPELLHRLREMPHLEVLGLMTVPPIGPEAVVRPIFRRLSELADRYGLPERSMGMSDDYEWAVEEGATLVRVGRALFVD